MQVAVGPDGQMMLVPTSGSYQMTSMLHPHHHLAMMISQQQGQQNYHPPGVISMRVGTSGSQVSHQRGGVDINSALRRGAASLHQNNFGDDDLDLIITAMKDREPMERSAVEDFTGAIDKYNSNNNLSPVMRIAMEALKIGFRQRIASLPSPPPPAPPAAVSLNRNSRQQFQSYHNYHSSNSSNQDDEGHTHLRSHQSVSPRLPSTMSRNSINNNTQSSVSITRQTSEDGGSVSARIPRQECSICYESLNTSTRKPCLCIACGNSVCMECTKKFTMCPSCRKPMPSSPVTNKGLLDILERLERR